MQNVESVMLERKDSSEYHPFMCLIVWNDHLYGGSYDGYICKWNKRGALMIKVRAHNSPIHNLLVWNNRLCSAAANDVIKIWNPDLSRDSDLRLSENSPQNVWSLKVWNDQLYACGFGYPIRTWTKEGRLITIDVQVYNVVCLEVWKDHLCTAEGTFLEPAITLWDCQLSRKAILRGHTALVYCMTVWKDYLCTGDKDSTIRMWRYDERDTDVRCECITIIHTKSPLNCLRVWYEYLISGHSNGWIKIWTWDQDATVKVSFIQEFTIPPETSNDSVTCLLSWDDKRLCVSSFKGVALYTAAWNPFKKSIFHPTISNQISAVIQIASRRDDGTANYPECNLYILPNEILAYILSFIK